MLQPSSKFGGYAVATVVPSNGGVARKCRGGSEGIGVWLLTHKSPLPTPAPPKGGDAAAYIILLEGMLPWLLSFGRGLKSKAPQPGCLA